MRYRPELDGLRAVAVLPVLLFHAGFTAFTGGFVGVDIFFVLSGYLITRLIHEEQQSDSFSLVRFYERRARRILPCLFLVCVACIPFAWAWMLPVAFRDFSQSLIAVVTFCSNFLFWLHSGYFAGPSETTPLLHTWSLAVEEQFYLFFPLVLLACRRFSLRGLFTILLVASLLSLGLAEYVGRGHASANFYLMPSRAWELGVGALLAITDSSREKLTRGVREVMCVAGVAAVACSIVFFDDTLRHPGLITLVPVLGTALLISAASAQTFIGRLLVWRPLVGVGLISYGAYLWHQPLFVFTRIRFPTAPHGVYVALIGLSLVLALVSWRFVEQPFRAKGVFSRSQIFTFAAGASAVMLMLGLAGNLSRGFPQRLPAEVQKFSSWSRDWNTREDLCAAESKKPVSTGRSCLYGSPTQPRVELIGDSHALALSYRLSETLAAQGLSLRATTANACPPTPGINTASNPDCEQHNRQLQRYLLTDPGVKTVVIAARWTLDLEGDRFNNGEGGVELGDASHLIPLGKGREFLKDPDRIATLGKIYRDSIEALLRSGKHVVLVYPIPEVGWDVPQEVMRRGWLGEGPRGPITTSYEVFKARNANAYAQLDLLGDSSNLVRVKPADLWCNSTVPGRCIAELDGQPLYWDDDHPNYSVGSKILAAQIVAALKEKGWIGPTAN
ncbi:MAG: acyltransferase family protein [Gammaproteobacteria bacterium]